VKNFKAGEEQDHQFPTKLLIRLSTPLQVNILLTCKREREKINTKKRRHPREKTQNQTDLE